MKKNFPYILALLILLTACAKVAQEPPAGAPPALSEALPPVASSADEMADELLWAQATQLECLHMTGLNLDAVGEADDELFVSIYKWASPDDSVFGAEAITVLRIQLGTGETLAKIFPVAGDYNVLTGNLFSSEKDAIVLEVNSPGAHHINTFLLALDVVSNPSAAQDHLLGRRRMVNHRRAGMHLWNSNPPAREHAGIPLCGSGTTHGAGRVDDGFCNGAGGL